MRLNEIRQKNKELTLRLSVKNDYRMTDLTHYVRQKDLTPINQEILLYDLLKKAVAAQDEGRALEHTFGGELEAYVDEEARRIPPTTPSERRAQAFQLWGLLPLAFVGLSLARSLSTQLFLTPLAPSSPWFWMPKRSEINFLWLVCVFCYVLLNRIDQDNLWEKRDYFSASGKVALNPTFISYGLLALSVLLNVLLSRFLDETPLFALAPWGVGLLILALLSLYLLIRKALFRTAATDSSILDTAAP
ncbi:hypothetical protein ABB02_01309 [Clostridiaceae bacterium JG1575]|nr:hypothetical protein ABB02_01309 [Clostridiaceae bacterium JG1575]